MRSANAARGAVLVTAVLVCAAARALAGPGDPLDGGGCAPLHARQEKCARWATTTATKTGRSITRCHLQRAKGVADATADACEAKATLPLARRPVVCDPQALRALDGVAVALGAMLHGPVPAGVFCDATSGVAIDSSGEHPGFVPASRLGFRCADDVGDALGEVQGRTAACLLQTARGTLRNRPVDESSCRSNQAKRYSRPLARAVPRCPACVQAAIPGLVDDVVAFVDEHRADFYPCLDGWFFRNAGELDVIAPTRAAPAREVVRRVNRDETAVFPTFTSAPFATDVTFDPAGLAVVHVGANQEMRGCGDVRVLVERVGADDARTPLGTAEATGLTIQQTSSKPLFPLGIDVTLVATTVPAGSRLAVTVEVTNRCPGNRALILDYDAGVTPGRVVLRAK